MRMVGRVLPGEVSTNPSGRAGACSQIETGMPREQRFLFDEVAELYDRARPRYQQVLFDDVISLSGIAPNGRILEVGCGTGQATLPFASRGFRMLCLGPGPALARLAREKLVSFPEVEVVPCTFEEWPLEAERFNLVISAQALH